MWLGPLEFLTHRGVCTEPPASQQLQWVFLPWHWFPSWVSAPGSGDSLYWPVSPVLGIAACLCPPLTCGSKKWLVPSVAVSPSSRSLNCYFLAILYFALHPGLSLRVCPSAWHAPSHLIQSLASQQWREGGREEARWGSLPGHSQLEQHCVHWFQPVGPKKGFCAPENVSKPPRDDPFILHVKRLTLKRGNETSEKCLRGSEELGSLCLRTEIIHWEAKW